MSSTILVNQSSKHNFDPIENKIINKKAYLTYVRKYSELRLDLRNVKNMTGTFYKGIVNIIEPKNNCKTKYQIRDNLELFSQDVREMFLIITKECSGLIEYDLPKITTLKLMSEPKSVIFFNKWKMPLLKYLNITECRGKCVFDGCDFPNLACLYVNSKCNLLLKYSNIPEECIVITVEKREMEKYILYDFNVKTKILLETLYIINSQKSLCYDLETGDIKCHECFNSVIIHEVYAVCLRCDSSRFLSHSEIYKLYRYPYCHDCLIDLIVFMDKNGYANGYCDLCHRINTFSRVDAYAAKIINGDPTVYPIK